MREAEYYERRADGTVACRLCPHGCVLAKGQRGRCHSRVNTGGRLMAEAYGRVCAMAVDPVEKKPLLHFHPGARCFSLAAAGCNLSCLNCQNHSISQATPADVPHRHTPPADVPLLAEANNCPLVAYTYTEPLTYLEYTRDCARACHRHGLANILVTAGYINPEPLAELLPFIDAANIDLKSFSDDIYRSVSRASLAPVLRAITMMRDAGLWIEVTNLVIPGVNDDMDMIRRMCRWLADNGLADAPLHFSRFFPQHRMAHLAPTPVETLTEARGVATDSGMNHVYIGNVALPGAEDTRCHNCGTLLVRRNRFDVETKGFDGICPKCRLNVPGIWA